MPDRDTTLDAFITPDAETDGTEDGAETDQEADTTDVGSEQTEPEQTDLEQAEENQADLERTEENPAEDSSGDESEVDRVTGRAETTFAWSPDSRACEACGDQTQRRWRTDAGFVCPDCVDWERAPEQ